MSQRHQGTAMFSSVVRLGSMLSLTSAGHTMSDPLTRSPLHDPVANSLRYPRARPTRAAEPRLPPLRILSHTMLDVSLSTPRAVACAAYSSRLVLSKLIAGEADVRRTKSHCVEYSYLSGGHRSGKARSRDTHFDTHSVNMVMEIRQRTRLATDTLCEHCLNALAVEWAGDAVLWRFGHHTLTLAMLSTSHQRCFRAVSSLFRARQPCIQSFTVPALSEGKTRDSTQHLEMASWGFRGGL
ncbi:hypothetical protein C7974DRAFT_130570 [Boeremia exigua]|uniref:uncharacterized protein n=1 Tax=Boeremia exigua TaxID=749465 RepID=UPI001E8DDE44|nr:uncharacterized protein C7974DRAFT_130570 [Boeremia exigua]KAH6639396.1 hypothetical protein C7974DRAFT_130570 [Boeremia exigua]